MGILLFKCSCLKKFSATRTWVNVKVGVLPKGLLNAANPASSALTK